MEEAFCIKPRGGGGYVGGGGGGGTKCGRWNPTSEQVKVLTDLFRSGLRTPSTDQIQKISTQLSFYGKIESKNVFYWFQNHKARERQKRRRVSVSDDDDHHHHDQQKENLHSHFDDIQEKTINSSPAPSVTHFGEINQQISEPCDQKVKETLELFPLNSFSTDQSESPAEKQHLIIRLSANDCKGNINASSFSYGININGAEMDHPTLDLRLSSL